MVEFGSAAKKLLSGSGVVSRPPAWLYTAATKLIASSTKPWPAQRPWSGGVSTNPFAFALSAVVRPLKPTLGAPWPTAFGLGIGMERAAPLAALPAGTFAAEFL